MGGVVTNLELFADHYQIHVLDDDSEGDLSLVWTDRAFLDGLGVAEDGLAICTDTNMIVDVGVEVLAQEPDDDSDDYDHVVEASVNLVSGRMVVLGCTDYLPDAARIDAPVGWTRVRVSRRNLAAAVFPDRDCEDEPEAVPQDIRLQAWPAPCSPPRAFKHWIRPDM